MNRRVRPIACLVLATAGAAALAQSTHPALEELDRESRALCAQMQESVVRVALPPPKWASDLAAQGNPLEKWKDTLDPAVRAKLEERTKLSPSGEFHPVSATVTGPASRPATAPISAAPLPAAGGSVTIVAPVRVGEQVQFRQVTLTFSNHVAVVLDDKGHVLVPLYIEREVVGDRKLPVTFGDGHTVPAKFVGSDRMMNLTVLQMDQPAGRAVRVTAGRPPAGALVMMVSPSVPPVMHLAVWTGGIQDLGLVASMDGGVYGFARFGHFLQLADAKPVVEQLVLHGEIKRARLGVMVAEISPQDGLRQQKPLLANHPALKVLDVTAGSAAAAAGLKPNDLILTLAGKPVGDTTEFAIAIAGSSGPTELRIIRDDAESTVRVELKPQ